MIPGGLRRELIIVKIAARQRGTGRQALQQAVVREKRLVAGIVGPTQGQLEYSVVGGVGADKLQIILRRQGIGLQAGLFQAQAQQE